MSLPEPYYEDGSVTIYHGDCREVLPDLSPQSFDVVLTDPPFFMPAAHYSSRVNWQKSWSDTSALAAFWGLVLDEVVRVTKRTGHALTFCDGESYPVFFPEAYRRFDTVRCLVWDKGHVGMGRVWRRQHELVMAARWQEAAFYEDGTLRADVFQFRATASANRTHPVEKPTDMLAWLLKPTAPPGGAVLEPFMGSGTTLEAAKLLGVRAVGIEGEEKYCEIAAERCRQEVLFL